MNVIQGGGVSNLLQGVEIPRMFRARQSFPEAAILPQDLPQVIFAELSKPEIAGQIKPGLRIAITAGSRGIANVAIITKAIVDFVKTRQAEPFIVPAMGSHGGATAEGQLEVLAGYGITPDRMGCPIHSCMDAVLLGE